MDRRRSSHDIIDTIVLNIFRYVLCFGLTTHVYDTQRHQLVHSRLAHCYSLSLHAAFIGLTLVFYFFADDGSYHFHQNRSLFVYLLILLTLVNALSLFAAIISQWTVRTNVSKLFNEILEIWHRDMAHLEGSREVRRQSGKLFLFKTLTSALIIAHFTLGIYQEAESPLSVAKNVIVFLLLNVIMAVMYVFCSSLLFSDYLFRILNFNLALLVEEIRSLSSDQSARYARRHEMRLLASNLSKIGRIHAKLQRWVMRFKDMYQVELLLIMMSFFVLQVFMLFVLSMCIHMTTIDGLAWYFLATCSVAILRALDFASLFYICRELLDASCKGGLILKDLPTQRIRCTKLERCVEMMCLQFKCERLHLSICGLVDLDWGKGFAMTESAFLYILLLIQMHYESS